MCYNKLNVKLADTVVHNTAKFTKFYPRESKRFQQTTNPRQKQDINQTRSAQPHQNTMKLNVTCKINTGDRCKENKQIINNEIGVIMPC